ncbi:Thymidylate kinase-like protein [Drosera capensis]
MDNGAAGTNQSPRGALVVLEGLDRSGKSSQCSKLVSYLEGIGIPAELWRFPNRTTSVGKMISAYLANEAQLDDRTVHLLFSANRWEKRSSMEDKLKAGITLVPPERGLPAPDLVLYLDISPEFCEACLPMEDVQKQLRELGGDFNGHTNPGHAR